MLILYIILTIIAIPLVLALFVSKKMDYEKSITINATKEKVWSNVSSLSAMDGWSPWLDKDPDMERDITGTDGTPGAKSSWKSSAKDVGEGSQTIIALDPPNRIDTRLDFVKPFKSTADAYVTLDGNDGEVVATWGFKSKLPYPMNLMKLFMNFEKGMDKDFGGGLSQLKILAEKD